MSGASAGIDWGAERPRFGIPEGVAYLNTASLAPQLVAVREAAEAALERLAAPWTIASFDWFSDVERLRTLFARVIGGDPEGVALVPATSYGLAVAAANLEAGPGERILVLDEEYPSAVYTWRAFARRTGAELHFVRREDGQSWSEAILEALDERVRIASLPNVHWTNGALVELAPVARRLRELGASLVPRQPIHPRFGGCEPAPGVVLGRPGSAATWPPCVLAMLGSRSPNPGVNWWTRH